MRQIFLTLISMGFATAFLGATASAQEPRALAERIVEVGKFDQSILEFNAKTSAEIFKSMMVKGLRRENPDISDEKVAEFNKIVDSEYGSAIDELSDPIKNLLIDFYVINFSEDELSALLDLNRSPIHRKQLSFLLGFIHQANELQAKSYARSVGDFVERVTEWHEAQKKSGLEE